MTQSLGPRSLDAESFAWGTMDAAARWDWWQSVLAVLPARRHEAPVGFGEAWVKWTNSRGLWVLTGELRDFGPRARVTVQLGSNVWHLEDSRVDYILLVLRVLGAVE